VISGTKYLDILDGGLNMLEKILGMQGLWQLLFPVCIIGILIPAYLNLKKAKMKNPNDDEDDEFRI
jgi:hypothetical protein